MAKRKRKNPTVEQFGTTWKGEVCWTCPSCGMECAAAYSGAIKGVDGYDCECGATVILDEGCLQQWWLFNREARNG